MSSARYFMKYKGLKFEDYVKEKFEKMFPVFSDKKILEEALMFLKFSTIIPEIKNDKTINKSYKHGMDNLQTTGAVPASVGPNYESPSKVDAMCRGQGEPQRLRMDAKYTTQAIKDYHSVQKELLELLNIACDDKGYMIVNNTRRATPQEFVQAIDTESKSVMNEYADLRKPTQMDEVDPKLNKKIELCFEILIQRLNIHSHVMESENDFMTEEGWNNWRVHTYIIASFAVYLLSLQLYRYKKYESFC